MSSWINKAADRLRGIASAVTAAAALAFSTTPGGAVPASEPFQVEITTDEHSRLMAVYPTVAGFHYTVEESQDLLEWQAVEGGWHYGMGARTKIPEVKALILSPIIEIISYP